MAITELSYLLETRRDTLGVGIDILKANKNPFLYDQICKRLWDVLVLDPEDELGLNPNCVEGFWKWLEKKSPELYQNYSASVNLMRG